MQGEPSKNEDNIDFMPTVFENSGKSGFENSKDQSQARDPKRSCKVRHNEAKVFMK